MSILMLTFKSRGMQIASNSAYPARRICAAAAVLCLSFCFSSVSLAFNGDSSEPFLPELKETVLIRDYPVIRHASMSENAQVPERIQQIRILLKYGLEHSDSQSLGYAQGLLNYWQNAENVPDDVRLYRAIIAQQQHAFDRALSDLAIVLEHNPQHSQARATRAAIHLAMGNYERAAEDCRATALTADPLQTANCLAQVQGPRGQARVMAERLENLLTLNSNVDINLKREVLTTLGDLYVMMKNQKRAQLAYTEALAISPNHPYLVAQFSELLIQHEEYEELAGFLRELKSTLGTRLYQAIAERNQRTTKELWKVSAASIRNELEMIDSREDSDTAKYWAFYFLYIEPDEQQALQYAQLNWQSQKSLSDARLLKRAAEAANDTKQLTRLDAWLNERAIVDSSLQSIATKN